MLWAWVEQLFSLFEANHSLLHRPVERQVNMRGEFKVGQCSTLGDRLDDLGREKRQSDQAGGHGAPESSSDWSD